MNNLSSKHFITVWLFSILSLLLQSCDDQSAKLDSSKVHFTLEPGVTSVQKAQEIDIPDGLRLRVSIKSSRGAVIFSDYEIKVSKTGDDYVADLSGFLPGAYTVTDLIILNDSEVLNVAPKRESQFGALVTQSLPYNFLVAEDGVTDVTMQVLDAREEKPEAFGYASFSLNTVNKLSFILFKAKGGKTSLKEATAEIRLGKHLVKKFSVKPGMNTIAVEGDPNAVYTLAVYAVEAAKVLTFSFKDLKRKLGMKPLKITLEPALLLSVESYLEDEYYSQFRLEGTGSVNINWGDGYEDSQSLPFEGPHLFTTGKYTIAITGDLDQITNLWHFADGDILYAITGLTNLTALKTYNPSWGAVPIKVNLSNCKKLETIHIEKFGGPQYETLDLRTDFQLPDEHFIREFFFNVNEIVSAEALEVFVDNIYNNTIRRNIYGGNFFVYLFDTPSSVTQHKLHVLEEQYNWDVRLGESIWDISHDGTEVGSIERDFPVPKK